VRVLNKQTRAYSEYKAKLIFLNAGAFNSTWILMNSKSERFPNGMGNDSGELGHNAMDHYIGGGASAETDLFSDKYYKGRRPNGIYIPRFQNLEQDSKNRNYLRGFQFQGRGSRAAWWRTIPEASYGLDLKNELLQPGKWQIGIMGLGEMLPRHENKISLHPIQKDQYGLPILEMDVAWGENEINMGQDMIAEAMDILQKGGLQNVQAVQSNAIPASSVHEMGTARMGRDPKTSVLNKWNQIHAVKNVFVTDGACMTSSACQNPSLTYMALTARAANYAVEQLKKGEL
ncbi:MAG: GMC family oxidoreductase, partial [Bacteroidota bacterium]